MVEWLIVLQANLQGQGVPAVPEDKDVLAIWRWIVTMMLGVVVYLYVKDQLRRKGEDKRKFELECELKVLNAEILTEAKVHSKELLDVTAKVVKVVENNTDTIQKNIETVGELIKETKTLREIVTSNIKEAIQGKGR